MRLVISRFQYPHHLSEPVPFLISGIDLSWDLLRYPVASSVIVEKVVGHDERPDQETVAGIPELVFQEVLQALLVGAHLAKRLRVVYARMDVIFQHMVFQIFQKRFVLLRELRSVVRQQVVELVWNKDVHPLGNGLGGFVFEYIGP